MSRCTRTTVGAGALLLALSMLACEGMGIDPPTDRFFNPIALAVDPRGHFLLVANGDFGLTYTSASVVPVDLDEVGQTLGRLRWEQSLHGKPVDIRGVLLPGYTVRIGAFAGRMRIDPQGRVAYVASRQDGTIYAIDLQRDEDGRLMGLGCGGRAEPLQRCAETHRLKGHPKKSLDTGPGPEEYPLQLQPTLLREPFGLDFIDYSKSAAHSSQDTREEDRGLGLIVTYLRGGHAALFSLDPETALPRKVDPQSDHIELEGFAARDVVVHPDGRQAFLCARNSGTLRSLMLGPHEERSTDLKIEKHQTVSTGSTGSLGSTDTRALAISGAGDRIFVARRHIPSVARTVTADLVVMARSLSPYGSIRLDVMGVLPLDERPISMAFLSGSELLAEDPDPEGSGAAPQEPVRLPDLLFALCYDAGTLLVIDASHLVVLATLELGKTPYDIALAPLGGELGRGEEAGGLGLAYVTHFRGDRVSVININPRSPNWLKLIGVIRGGTP